MSRKKSPPPASLPAERIGQRYDAVLAGLVDLLESARRGAARSMGRRITEEEQRGQRAAYGERLIERLSGDLTKRFGRGFGVVNLA